MHTSSRADKDFLEALTSFGARADFAADRVWRAKEGIVTKANEDTTLAIYLSCKQLLRDAIKQGAYSSSKVSAGCKSEAQATQKPVK